MACKTCGCEKRVCAACHERDIEEVWNAQIEGVKQERDAARQELAGVRATLNDCGCNLTALPTPRRVEVMAGRLKGAEEIARAARQDAERYKRDNERLSYSVDQYIAEANTMRDVLSALQPEKLMAEESALLDETEGLKADKAKLWEHIHLSDEKLREARLEATQLRRLAGGKSSLEILAEATRPYREEVERLQAERQHLIKACAEGELVDRIADFCGSGDEEQIDELKTENEALRGRVEELEAHLLTCSVGMTREVLHTETTPFDDPPPPRRSRREGEPKCPDCPDHRADCAPNREAGCWYGWRVGDDDWSRAATGVETQEGQA